VSQPIKFNLVVDDFGIQYVGDGHANHLINALEKSYTVSKDWSGSLYCGITLDWDYTSKYITLSMPGYITVLHKYQQTMPKWPQQAPHIWTVPAYGQRIQYSSIPDESQPASKSEITSAQQIVGTLLSYAHAVGPTLIIALSHWHQDSPQQHPQQCREWINYWFIAAPTLKPISGTMPHTCNSKYTVTHPTSMVQKPKAKSRIDGYLYFGNKKNIPFSSLTNAPLLCHSTVLKHVVSSVAEAEFGAVFVNAKTGTVTRTILTEMGHPQEATELKIDNSTSD
jgi:hypothetical protein